jgi:hypothetical protein
MVVDLEIALGAIARPERNFFALAMISLAACPCGELKRIDGSLDFWIDGFLD